MGNKKEKPVKEITMNLHELNKVVIKSLPPLEEKRMKQLKQHIKDFVSSEGKYYMLLSMEKRDYTLFTFKDAPEPSKFANEVLDILKSRGVIKEFDVKSGAIEIWIDDVFYALFPYDAGVVEI